VDGELDRHRDPFMSSRHPRPPSQKSGRSNGTSHAAGSTSHQSPSTNDIIPQTDMRGSGTHTKNASDERGCQTRVYLGSHSDPNCDPVCGIAEGVVEIRGQPLAIKGGASSFRSHVPEDFVHSDDRQRSTPNIRFR
jgi:hypothetical protein